MINLTAKTIGRGDGPHLLITAGVHGDEFEPMLAVRRLIRELGRRIVRGRIRLVPVVNHAAFHLGRRTAGVMAVARPENECRAALPAVQWKR
ncbi:MAG: succinylglutamate desuccinylase/aspartoacylase family protein [Pirellulales bacterium]